METTGYSITKIVTISDKSEFHIKDFRCTINLRMGEIRI